MRVKIYIEGGGPGQAQDAVFRQGWSQFFRQWNLARQPAVVRGQSREKTWDLFQQAVRSKSADELPLLLVDSDATVATGLTSWQHLAKRGWRQPEGADADDAFLMICTMETWILAGWRDQSDVTQWPDFEAVPERRISEVLKRVSAEQYQKGPRSFEFLGQIDAVQVSEKCRSAKSLRARLQGLMGRR